MSPKSRGRAPGRGRSPKRQHQPVRRLTPLDHILHEARGLHECDLLAAEAVASGWLGAAWLARTVGQLDAEGDLVREVIAATRGDRADAAYLAVYALATIPDESWRTDVEACLATAPPGLAPVWAVDPSTRAPEHPVGAQRWSDPWGSAVAHLLRYAEPVEHSLLVSETTVGGRYVHAIDVGIQEAEPERVIGDMTMSEVEPGEALADVADAMWITDVTWPPQDDPAYALTRALAHWRTRDHRRDVGRPPLTDDERRRLIDEFIALQDGEADHSVLEVLADTFVDFGDGYLHGGVLAWSPGAVEVFMLDWVHRKVLLEPDCVDALPDVLAAWVDFALRRRGLSPHDVAPVVEAVAALQDQFVDAAAASRLDGPAKEITARLLAEGIDIHDRDAVSDVVRAHNAEQIARRLFES